MGYKCVPGILFRLKFRLHIITYLIFFVNFGSQKTKYVFMKRFLTYVLVVLLATACYNDDELKSRLDDVDQRLTKVETLVSSLNTQLTKLQELIAGKQFISNIEDKEDGTHVITFVNSYGEMSTMTLKDGSKGADGSDGQTPDISVKQAPDGKWYWTVNGEWLLDSEGKTVPVTGERGVTPSMKIENGKWYVSYDNGITYVECGQATGDAFFKDARLSEDGKTAYLTLADGTVLTFEIYKEFGIAVEVPSSLIYSGQTKEYAYTITGGDENTILEVLPKGNWEAEAKATDEKSGVIAVTAPDSPEVGKVIVLLSDGANKTLMRTLTFVAGNVHVSTTSVESPASGGVFNVDVTTNLEFTAEIESDQTWARLIETKAYEVYTKTISVSVDKNEMPYAREARLTLKNDGNIIESIVIYQNPVTYPDNVMVLVMQPLAKDSCVVLPVTYNRTTPEYNVDWGDGTKETVKSASYPKHKYNDASRLYPVQISGAIGSVSRVSVTKHDADLVEVIQWGDLSLSGVNFEYQTNLIRIAAPKGDELKNVSSCNNMFHNCKSLKEIPAKFMQGLSPKTTNFNNTFDGCESLEYLDPDIFKNFTTAGIAMRSLFLNCKNLKNAPTFKYFKFKPSCEYLYNQTFSGCESLTEIPEHMFNETAKAVTRSTKLTNTFKNCKSLEVIPDSFWENLPVDKIVELNNAFQGCESLKSESLGFLNKLLKVYKWQNAFYGCTSLTTLPEYEVEMDGKTVSVPVYMRDAEEYKAYFANRNYSATNFCFKDCVNLEGYFDKIPQSWGGGWDGTTEKPSIEVTATLPEKDGYFSIDFHVKGKSVATAYYYLTAKAIADEILPKYNNSYSELCEQKGIEIESEYLKALNSDQGLTLGFTEGVPNVEYILIVSGKNMFGESYAYKVQATTAIPKGSDEYERYLGEWTVTSASATSEYVGYDRKPISFDIKIEPFRVNEIYNVYGWGVTKFADRYPMKMFFEDGKLCAWTGAHHGSVIYEGYPYSDGISYNIVLNSYTLWEDGSYGIYMADGEKVGEAEYAEGSFNMNGVKSKYYAERGYDIMCHGFDFCLSMGGPGWSKIFIAPEVVKDQYVIHGEDGKNYAPYILAPYTFTRKATKSNTASVTVERNKALMDSGECLPASFGKAEVKANANEPAKGFYRF